MEQEKNKTRVYDKCFLSNELSNIRKCLLNFWRRTTSP